MILENTCNLCVIAVVSDDASCNRSFIKVHRPMSNIAGCSVSYHKSLSPKPVFVFLQTLPT